MSGAEVIAVLGIISSVIAIVDGTKQLYDAASSAAGLPEAFREVSGRLPIVRGILQCAEQHIRDSPTSNQSCLAMKPLIDACEEKAKRLELIFQKVIPGDDASRLERYFRAARTLGKGGKVETLMEGLMKDVLLLASEHGMETATSRQIGELEKAIKDISTLEPSIPDAAFEGTAFTNNNFGNGPMTNNNVAGDQKSQVNYGSGKQFQAETQTFHMGHDRVHQQTYRAQSQQFISTRAAPTPERLQQICEGGVLDELRFRGLNERYEDIKDAHRHTFQWIYERPELKFLQWLKSGNGVFWITGKPGSGKSTLMKSIHEDKRTKDNLPTDIENRLIASFFFHGKGENALLKSQKGLFRAILYKVLSEYRQLIPLALTERYERLERNVFSGQRDSNSPDFSMEELRDGFKAIANQSQIRLHLCLLIDGLDEFSGPYATIVKTLAELIPTTANAHVRVQLCLSSRPLREFEKAYLQHTHLKVQDLTADDMRLYVTTKFKRDAQLSDLLKNDQTTTNLIIEQILHKSEGVFLWVALVVDSLIESLDNGDDMKILQRRLSVLPAGLVPLYKSMIGQIQPFYYQEAGRVFQMVHCAARPLSPLAVSFAGDNSEDAITHELHFSDAEISKRHSDVSKQLKARTAGLIEMKAVVRDHGYGPRVSATANKLEDKSLPWKQFQIQYMHLTAKEFLTSEDAPRWLADKISASDEVHLTIAACCLRQLRATNSPALYDYQVRILGRHYDPWDDKLAGIIFMVMFHTRQAERLTGTSKLPYLRCFNDSLITMEGKCSCVSWGLQCHWTKHRYAEWSESDEWLSDFISCLVALRMSQSVIDAFDRGYDPATKAGRPLLLYAMIGLDNLENASAFETQIIDPFMVKELLERGCDPNQSFDSPGIGHVRGSDNDTVWGVVLLQVSVTVLSPSTDFGLRWLQVIRLFLDYGAKPDQLVMVQNSTTYGSGSIRVRKMSALTIFDQAFPFHDEPSVASIRRFMVSNGAIQYDKTSIEEPTNKVLSSSDFVGPVGNPERNSRSTLSVRRERATQEIGKNGQSGKRGCGCCAQS